jgi:hypothetical protein
MHDAEHASVGLGYERLERDAVDAGDGIVVDRSEGHDQRRYAIDIAGVLVLPRAGRMKAEYATGEMVG